MYWWIHCFVSTAVAAVVKLSARLVNHRALTHIFRRLGRKSETAVSYTLEIAVALFASQSFVMTCRIKDVDNFP